MQEYVVRRVIEGVSNKEIALEHGVTTGAINSHLKRAAAKLGYRKRTGAGVRSFVAAQLVRRETRTEALQEALEAVQDSASLGQAKARLKFLLLAEVRP
jgi:transposase-like protein